VVQQEDRGRETEGEDGNDDDAIGASQTIREQRDHIARAYC